MAAVEKKNLGDKSLASSLQKVSEDPDVIYAKGLKQFKVEMPEGSSLEDLQTWVGKKIQESNREFQLSYEVDGHVLDVNINFFRALAEMFGWVEMVPQPGFFGSPPTLIAVQTGPDTVTQVPWGRINVPKLGGYLQTGFNARVNPPRFMLTGVIKYRYKGWVDEIMDLTRKFVREQSIYRGKAVKVSWEWQRDGEDYNPIVHAPKFLDLSDATIDDLILPKETMTQLQMTLFGLIEHYEALKRNRVPLKGGVLLSGPYGTGKTLTAKVAGALAVKNDWTFIMLDSILDLEPGLRFAEFYGPTVLAGEDIDRAVLDQSAMEISQIQNLMDGVDTKKHEIITILTTNHMDKILDRGGKALLRPGRLSVVEIPIPDVESVERLIRLYAGGLLHEDANMRRMAEAVAELKLIPSSIRDILEQGKVAAMIRTGGEDIKGQVMEDDIIAVANQRKTLNDKLIEKEPESPPALHMTFTPQTIERLAKSNNR